MPINFSFNREFEYGPEPYRPEPRLSRGPRRPRASDVRVTAEMETRTYTVQIRLTAEMLEEYELAREYIFRALDRQLAQASAEMRDRSRWRAFSFETSSGSAQGAWARAEATLLENLTPVQRQQYEENHGFEVISQHGSRFIIRLSPVNNIIRLSPDGRPMSEHCIVSAVDVPLPDQILMQKLMLECDEDRFWRMAKHTVARSNDLPVHPMINP